MENAVAEGNTAVTAVEAFLDDTFRDLENLAMDPDIIAYVELMNTSSSPIITDTLDPNYDIYSNFDTKINSVFDYSYKSIYDFIFVASENNCSTGTDGCYIGVDSQISPNTWNLHERPWFVDLGTSDEVLSSPYLDSLSGEYAITFVKTVKSGDEVIGYLGIDILLSSLQDAVYAYDYFADDQSKQLLIFQNTPSGSLLIQTTEEQLQDYVLMNPSEFLAQDQAIGHEGDGLSALIQNVVDSEVVNTNFLGNTRLVYSYGLERVSWTVSVIVEENIQLGLELAFVLLIGSIFIMMIFVSLILSKKINRTLSPITNILDSIDQIKNGNYNVTVKVDENNELKFVADALNIMSKEIGKQVDLVYQTYVYDTITGLKNRRAVHKEIDEEILHKSDKAAVCLLAVDNLKNINVTKGQSIGDELLKAIANRLKSTLGMRANVYFNGGNEFVFLLPNIRLLETVEHEVLKVMESFQIPLEIKNMKVDVKINVGIAVYPSDGKNMSELMKKCDTALFKAKETSAAKFVFYNDQLTREVNYRAQISEELSLALNKNQLYLKYQPLIDNKNEIYGFEALVRWKSPTLGEISPQIFIANAEESHLIIPIGTWILEEACRTQVKLQEYFGKDFVMSVNVSPIQITQKTFLDVLKRIVKETDIDPKNLVLEITEGVLIESSIYLEDTIKFLHEIGARIALDDFGTGYASLTYLRKIPFDNLKIDKSFVDGIFAGKKDHSIIGTIVQLVHNLDMKVIAEGVETRKQYEYLKQIQTDVFQGFLFSKALGYDDLVKFIDQFYKVAKTKRIDVFGSKDYYE